MSSPSGQSRLVIASIRSWWLPIGKSVRPIEPWNSTSPTIASLRRRMVEDDMAGRVAGAMIDVEGQLADRRRVAVDQPAVAFERLAGDPVGAAVILEPRDPEAVVLVRPLDLHAELVGEDLGRSAMVDMAVGQQDLLDRHLVLRRGGLEPVQVAAGIGEGRRASSSVHQIRQQFCCSGVTGMIAALKGGSRHRGADGLGDGGLQAMFVAMQLDRRQMIAVAALPWLGGFAWQRDYDVPFVPTPHSLVQKMLDLAGVGPADYLIDLGCGDGRIAVAAALRGARALGVDLDPMRIEEAHAAARIAGVEGRALFRRQDLFLTPIYQASVVDALSAAGNQPPPAPAPAYRACAPGARIVSHAFHMGDWRPEAEETHDGRRIFLWIVPAVAGGRWELQPDGGAPVAAGDRAALSGGDRHAGRGRDRGRRAARHGARLHRRRAALARHDRRRGDRRRGLGRAPLGLGSRPLGQGLGQPGAFLHAPGFGRSARRRARPRGSRRSWR